MDNQPVLPKSFPQTPPQSKQIDSRQKLNYWVTPIIVLLIMIGGIIYIAINNKNKIKQIPIQKLNVNITPTVTSIQQEKSLFPDNIYMNSMYNFEIEIPTGYTAAESSHLNPNAWLNKQDELLNEMEVREEKHGATQGYLRISIQKTNNNTLKEWVEKAEATTPGGANLIQAREIIEFNGTPAGKIQQFVFDGSQIYYIFLKENYVFILSHWDNQVDDKAYRNHQNAYQQILFSFRFIDQVMTKASEYCKNANGTWITQYNECEFGGSSNIEIQNACVSAGGSFTECASGCRHRQKNIDEGCGGVCVPLCKFN